MRDAFKQRHISSFAALVVFVLFAACVLSVLLSGAGVYRRLVRRGQESYAQRTCQQYIATKVHQCPVGSAVSVEEFGGETALVLREQMEGEVYLTRVYCHEGWLMELFAAESGEFTPGDGENLLPVQDLSLELEEGLLQVAVTDEYGKLTRSAYALRGGEGGEG